MWLSSCFVYFVIYSCLGWIYETIADTIYSGAWENRGFLYGPVCPIYGIGAVAVTMIYDGVRFYAGIDVKWWHIFLFSVIGSVFLEFSTSWLLEKFFHALWWDYSGVPFNIQGRVCLPASLGFGVMGLVIIYIIDPVVKSLTAWIPPIGMEFAGLMMMGVIAADLTLTISALTQFEHMVYRMEKSINDRMGAVVDTVKEKKQNMGDKLSEERERFSRENLEQFLQNSAISFRLALRRVRRFRYPRIDKKRLEYITQSIRARIRTSEQETDHEAQLEDRENMNSHS